MHTVCSWEAARDPTGVPPSVRPPTWPSPLAHLLAPFSCLLDFSICWPSKKKTRREEKVAAAGATVGPKSTTTGAAVPFWLCLYELLLLLLPLLQATAQPFIILLSAPSAMCGCGFRTHRVSRAARSHFNAFLSFAAKQVQFSPQKQQQTAAAAATTTTNNNYNRQQLQIHEN